MFKLVSVLLIIVCPPLTMVTVICPVVMGSWSLLTPAVTLNVWELPPTCRVTVAGAVAKTAAQTKS